MMRLKIFKNNTGYDYRHFHDLNLTGKVIVQCVMVELNCLLFMFQI